MKNKLLWVLYIAYVLVLVVLVSKTVNYVNGVLQEYEASQPEVIVQAQVDRLKAAVANDTTESVITFHEIEQAEYDIDISDFREYKDKLKNAKELTYKTKNSYSETEQQFYVLADEEPVAVVTLESVKEEIKLAILTVNKWQVKSVTPILTLATYNYIIEAPEGFRVTINGTELSEVQKAENGWETYVVETLYSEPEIKLYDSYGNEAIYDIVDNHVIPMVYTYRLKLPDNFQVTIEGTSADGYVTAAEEIAKFRYAAEYSKMPQILTYTITNVACEPEIAIFDNFNQKVECVFENYAFEVTEQSCLDYVPEEITSQIDVLETGKQWSRFMTGDLEGSKKGFGTMKQYFIQDSYLYDVAYKWVTNKDSTYTPKHSLKNPPFTEEKVSNFVSYGDQVFSCSIYFVKHMYLTSYKMDVDDTMNSTFYFMKYDDTEDGKDNPRWVIIDIQENISE